MIFRECSFHSAPSFTKLVCVYVCVCVCVCVNVWVCALVTQTCLTFVTP